MSEPPSGIEIDTPGLTDLDTLVGLWQALVRDQRGYGTTIRADQNEANARTWLSAQMTFDGVRVARDGETIVGFVTFALRTDRFDRDGQAGIIHNLFVREGYRDRGIGSTLLSRAEALLVDRGVDSARLEIMTANRQAEAFYREQGYLPHRTTFRKSLGEDD